MKALSFILLALTFNAFANEEFPAGEGSTSDFSVQAFSHPMSGTRSQLRRDFNVGNSFFNTVWVASPASTTLRDGLGPHYNAVSCSSCHFKDGRGRGLPEKAGPIDVSLLFRLRVKNEKQEIVPHPNYGGQFQPFSVQGVMKEGDAFVSYETISGEFADKETFELARPIYQFLNLNYGPFGETTIASPRVAPQMIGLGLVELISESDILAKEDPYDMDGDGISGRANRVHSVVHNDVRLGRFGWKAGKASLIEQNAAAFNGDIGITSPLHPTEECTAIQTDCVKNMSEEDISMERLKLVTVYTQLLAVPKRRNIEKLEVKNGKEHFVKANCVACHTPSYVTNSEGDLDVLKNQTIYPYSDFLLHDMGDGLADHVEELKNEDEATTREWRTPPLWGLGMVPVVNGHSRYLHDGRARNLEEAILWHGGEAESSKKAYLELSKTERAELIEFLKDL